MAVLPVALAVKATVRLPLGVTVELTLTAGKPVALELLLSNRLEELLGLALIVSEAVGEVQGSGMGLNVPLAVAEVTLLAVVKVGESKEAGAEELAATLAVLHCVAVVADAVPLLASVPL